MKPLHVTLKALLLSLLVLTSLHAARSVQEAEYQELLRQIETERALLRNNPEAIASPNLAKLEQQASSLQRGIEQEARREVEQQAAQQQRDLAQSVVAYRDNINGAADRALWALGIVDEALSGEESALQRRIEGMIGRQELHLYLAHVGKDSQDAKAVLELSRRIEEVKAQRSQMQQDRRDIQKAKEDLKGLQSAVDSVKIADDLRQGNYLDASTGTLELIKKYLPDHSGKIAAEKATFRLFSETSGNRSINEALSRGMNDAVNRLEALEQAQRLTDGINKGLKGLGYLQEAKKAIEQWQKLKAQYDALGNDATTSAEGKRLLMAMNALGNGLHHAAQYLPPGLSDMLDFYADAMKLTGDIHEIAIGWYKHRDAAVSISGPLAQSRAVRDYDGGILDRDPLLNPDGSLGIYVDVDLNRHVIITDADGAARIISDAQYETLVQIASNLSALGIKMDNNMLASLLESDFRSLTVYGSIYNTTMSVEELEQEAQRAKNDMRVTQILESWGIEAPSDEDKAAYRDYERLIDNHLEFNTDCQPTPRQIQNLFHTYRNDPAAFEHFLATCGKKASSVAAASSEMPSGDPMSSIRGDFARLGQINTALESELAAYSGALQGLEADLARAKAQSEALEALQNDAHRLLQSCQGADGEAFGRKIEQVRAATHADMQKLKMHYEMAAELSAEACGYVQNVSETMGLKECKRYERLAKEAASASRQDANKAVLVAGVISGRYNALIAEQGDASGGAEAISAWIGRYEAFGYDPSAGNALASQSEPLQAEARALFEQIRSALHGASLPQAAVDEAEGMLGALMGSIDAKAQQLREMQERYAAMRSELEALEQALQNSALQSLRAQLEGCMHAPSASVPDDLRADADTADIFGPYADTKAKEALTCSRNISAVCAQIIPCKSDHDCPMDKVCGYDGICVAQSGDGGFDAGAWDARESERTQQSETYGGEDEGERFDTDTIRRANEENIRKLTEHNARGERDDEPSEWKPEKPHTQTSTSSSSQKLYYVLKETAIYLQRTGTCTAISYSLFGPSDAAGLKAQLKTLEQKNKLRLNGKNFPLYTKITTVKFSESPQEPELPKESVTCKSCPPGQHIGTDPDKRHCHSN